MQKLEEYMTLQTGSNISSLESAPESNDMFLASPIAKLD